MNSYNTIDDYIAIWLADIQHRLKDIRSNIQQAAPQAAEKIAYGIRVSMKLQRVLFVYP
jgi:uncharacterized protein YdhG (YjbR/CyaY superfamily)